MQTRVESANKIIRSFSDAGERFYLCIGKDPSWPLRIVFDRSDAGCKILDIPATINWGTFTLTNPKVPIGSTHNHLLCALAHWIVENHIRPASYWAPFAEAPYFLIGRETLALIDALMYAPSTTEQVRS